jgi:hypothetical protein
MFYMVNYCKPYLCVFAIKNSCKIYFTVNSFAFGLFGTSQHCSTAIIFFSDFYTTFVALVCLFVLFVC